MTPAVMSVSDTNAVEEVLTPRKLIHDFPLDQVKLVPEENYRWMTDEGMKADLASVDRDPSDGTLVNSYENLKQSIRAVGVNEPVGIVLRGDGFHHVVFGFTRVLAAKELNHASICAFVYDPTLPDNEALLLQMRENSPALKRPVNWVNEAKRFRDLTRQYQQEFESGRRTLPIVNGQKQSAAAATADLVSKVLGRPVNVLRTRLQTFEKVDQQVRDLAKLGLFSYNVTLEFLPSKGMTSDVTTAVLKEMRRRDPDFKMTSPEFVRQVFKWVQETHLDSTAVASADAGDGEDDAEDSSSCTPAAPVVLQHMSVAVARDLAIQMVVAKLLEIGVSTKSAADVLEKLKNQQTWSLVIGIGICASQIPPPHVAGKAFPVHVHSFVTRIYVAAFLRLLLPKCDQADKFDAWMSGSTTIGATQLLNRLEFNRIVDVVMSDCDYRTPLAVVVKKLVDEHNLRFARC